MDVNDRLPVDGSVSGSASQSGAMSWTHFDVTSWNVWFQADVYQQNGGNIATITVQTTLTPSISRRALPQAILSGPLSLSRVATGER